MSFDLDPAGADEIDAMARRDGVPFGTGTEPGFFTGTGKAALFGVVRGLTAKPNLLVGDAMDAALRPGAQAADKALGTSLGTWLDDQRKRRIDLVDRLRVDPLTTGFAGQIVGTFFDIGSSALLYTPEGAAIFEGYGRRQELLGKGVDPVTASAVGTVTGAATLVGVKAPVTLGQQAIGQGAAAVAKNVAYGGAVSVASGVAERGFSRRILEAAGYPQHAATLDPYDHTAMAAELTLGSLFSGTAAAIQARSTVRGQDATDAALAVTTTDHAQRRVAPGVPTDAKSTAAHSSALSTALDQVLRNDRVNVGDVLADTAFVRSPASPEVAAELRVHVADLLPVGAPSAPGPRGTFRPPAGAARGVRNNNPGNIEAGATAWQGQVGSDGRFATFDTPEAGIRALGRNLLAYQERHGLNTVEGIVNRWAPPGENNTGAYVRAVSTAVGVAPADRLNLRDAGTLQKLTAAIIRHENGGQPYPDEVLRAGVDLAIGGRSGEVVTERGMRVPFRYRVAEADQLVTSNDAALRPNPAYPVELQPRDRSRDASEAQIARIAGNLQPELLAESARASDGAPIVGPDGVVESGNGRMLALGRAYGGERGAEYRSWLEGNAERFGLEQQDVRNMRQPVLVRERTGEVDRAEFARQANESSVAAMSPTEQARSDAGRISDLSGLVTGEDGTINQAQSAGFLRQFVHANVGPNELGSVLQADGRISQGGLQRVRQAVFAKAYGDADLVAMLTESTDSNVRNVLAGLMRAAPAVARLQDLASAGARQPVELGATIARAAREFASMRAQGKTVDQVLSEGQLFDSLSPDMAALLRGIAGNANAPKRLGDMVGRLVDAIDALGDPRQRGMFDEGKAGEAIQSAATRADGPGTVYRQSVQSIGERLAGKQPGQLVQEMKAAGELTPLANNTILGLSETGGDPRRIADLVAHAEALAAEAPGRPPADVMADAVERIRSGQPTPGETSTSTRSQDPTVRAAAQVADLTPDMRVVLEDGTEVSAREVLARTERDRQQAANDSAAFDAAVSCFLRT